MILILLMLFSLSLEGGNGRWCGRPFLVVLERKFNLTPRCICSLYLKNIFKNVKKIWPKVLHLHPQSKCVCKVSPKIDTFYGLYKKYKNWHVKYFIFSTKICLFNIRHMTNRFIVKRHVACEDVCADFLFQFFWHFEICQIYISK
jgi:hypothetical protein